MSPWVSTVCWLAVDKLGISGRQVARGLGMSPSAVSKALIRERNDNLSESIWMDILKTELLGAVENTNRNQMSIFHHRPLFLYIRSDAKPPAINHIFSSSPLTHRADSVYIASHKVGET